MAIDDASRGSYAEILTDESGASLSTFLRAVAWFAAIGVTVERVLTDNDSGCLSSQFKGTCSSLNTRHDMPVVSETIVGLAISQRVRTPLAAARRSGVAIWASIGRIDALGLGVGAPCVRFGVRWSASKTFQIRPIPSNTGCCLKEKEPRDNRGSFM